MLILKFNMLISVSVDILVVTYIWPSILLIFPNLAVNIIKFKYTSNVDVTLKLESFIV